MKPTILIALLASLLACNKKSDPVADEPLQGEWRMTDEYIGVADGSVNHAKIDGITFRYTPTDSLYTLYYDLFLSSRLTDITDSTYFADDSNLPYHYKITGTVMELRHPCDEGCRWMFQKIKR